MLRPSACKTLPLPTDNLLFNLDYGLLGGSWVVRHGITTPVALPGAIAIVIPLTNPTYSYPYTSKFFIT